MEEEKRKYAGNEDRVLHLLKQQEAMAEKWRNDHHASIKYFEKIIFDKDAQIKSLTKTYLF